MHRNAWFFSLLVVVLGCGDDGSAAGVDAAVGVDAAIGADAAASFPLDGFGALAGDCDELDDELTDPAPSRFAAAIDFERGYVDADLDLLTDGGQTILTTPNAGGSSEYSEAFAFEVLARCEGAALLATEDEVLYDEVGAKTDFLAEIDGRKIGVSVTRAFIYPPGDPYPLEEAERVMTSKLEGILESSAKVADEHRWDKQILAVLAYGPDEADTVVAALDGIDPAIVADTIVWITVTNGDDAFIYCNGECPAAR